MCQGSKSPDKVEMEAESLMWHHDLRERINALTAS